MKKLLLISAVTAALVGCATGGDLKAPAPKTFAVETDDDNLGPNQLVGAVSYSGVTYRVRTEPNEPKAELDFWRERLQVYLDDAGYIFKGKKKIKAKGGEGYQLNFLAPTADTDYRFSVTMFLFDDQIVVAEAAGEQKAYKKVSKQINMAIQGISYAH